MKHSRLDKVYGKKKLLAENPYRDCTTSGWRNLIKKIDQTGSIDHTSGIGCPRSAHTNDNIEYLEKEVLSKEANPGSHPYRNDSIIYAIKITGVVQLSSFC